jgi:hypothetical protein
MSPSKIAGNLGRIDGIDRLEKTLNVHRPQDYLTMVIYGCRWIRALGWWLLQLK